MHHKLAYYGLVPVMFLSLLFGGALKETGLGTDHAMIAWAVTGVAMFALLLAIDQQLDDLRRLVLSRPR